VRKEQEGVLGHQSRVIFCKFFAGSGGGCSECEAHGENTFFVKPYVLGEETWGFRRASFRSSDELPRGFVGCVGRVCVLLHVARVVVLCSAVAGRYWGRSRVIATSEVSVGCEVLPARCASGRLRSGVWGRTSSNYKKNGSANII
jgi:hypothetical protein